MTKMKYEPTAGCLIVIACEEAVELAAQHDCEVEMSFNDVSLTATKESSSHELSQRYHALCDERYEAYKKSSEDIKAAKERAAQIAQSQDAVTAAIRTLPGLLNIKPEDVLNGKTKLDLLIGWLHSFAHHADDCEIDWNKAAGVKSGGLEWVKVLLQSGGYRNNEGVGEPPESFNTKEKMGRYIFGQAINCLDRGMPPHPITITFCERYFKL